MTPGENKAPGSENSYDEDHPEQDPAEGSREVIDHDLAEAGGTKNQPADKGTQGSRGGAA